MVTTYVRTLATGFWAASDELDYVTAAPYALTLILLSLPLSVVLMREASRET